LPYPDGSDLDLLADALPSATLFDLGGLHQMIFHVKKRSGPNNFRAGFTDRDNTNLVAAS